MQNTRLRLFFSKFSSVQILYLLILGSSAPLGPCSAPILSPVPLLLVTVSYLEAHPGQRQATFNLSKLASGFIIHHISCSFFPHFISSYSLNVVYLFIHSLKKHLLEYLTSKEPITLRKNTVNLHFLWVPRSHIQLTTDQKNLKNKFQKVPKKQNLNFLYNECTLNSYR